ncbi:hypothetical protein Pan216_09430 [Planctomycetes bacterium Pan216]|uniref:Uncharacterized protein n=1 Tax=Kolteria novifilia TaxID=2527975 RepID=A0A518AZG5_9BACT|nr:hypothetical protein Pan216_09430 [Planctomycetes bacterium Pan216]
MDRSREQRITELATGLSIGDLSQSELEELHDILASGEDAEETAQIVWKTLDLSLDLQASVGTIFQDTVRHRLDAERSASSQGFLDSLWSRLSFDRPKLQEIVVPDPRPRRRPRWLPLAIGGLLMLIGVALVAWWPKRTAWEAPIAKVASVRGTTRHAKRVLVPGASVDRQPMTVHEKSWLSLVWPEGDKATIIGPASVVVHPRGLLLLSGRAWIENRSPFSAAVGGDLAELEEGSQVAIEANQQSGIVGVEKGRARYRGAVIEAEKAYSGTGKPYPWLPAPVFEKLPDGFQVAGLAEMADWRFEGTIEWESVEASVELTLLGRPAERSDLHLRLEPGKLTIREGERAPRLFELSGAPLLVRRLEIIQRFSSRWIVRVDDIRFAVAAPASATRFVGRCEGGARLGSPVFSAGPSGARFSELPKPPSSRQKRNRTGRANRD